MTEPAEPSLLAEQVEKKPVRRRAAATAKPRATRAVKGATEEKTTKTATPGKTAKSTKTKSTRKKGAAAEGAVSETVERTEALNGRSSPAGEPSVTTGSGRNGSAAVSEEFDFQPRRSEPPPRTVAPAVSESEEWSPSRSRAQNASDATPTTGAPEGEQMSAPAAGTAENDGSGGPRRYPVYVPRSVARQLEAEGKEAPIAVNSADELPREIREAVAAAASPAQTPHSNQRPPREPMQPREHRDHRGHREHRENREPREHREPREPRYRESMEMPEALTGEPTREELGEGEGIVEISGKGFGFIRDAKRGFAQTPADIFVTPETVRAYNLRDGQWLKGQTRRGARGSQLHKLLEINGDDPETLKNLPAFDELTVISPEKRIRLETVPDRFTTRIVDMFCPIGKGQRGLIVAPPRTGKTTLLQHIGDAVVKNHPEVKLMILLVDERPEEVTDVRRNVPSAELFASSNDMDVKSHTRIAQLCIERAKRLVEQGKDVFILLDSITRVGRAFNNATSGGRTGSGGLDTRAMEIPRRLFAAARNTEEAGSLTIIGTVLIETNSRMDDVIFQEFKGTGNMELVLDRKISEQRIYPAIDIFLSGTRREELLIGEEDLRKISLIRRGLAGYKPIEAIERLLFFAKKFPTNAQMLAGIPG